MWAPEVARFATLRGQKIEKNFLSNFEIFFIGNIKGTSFLLEKPIFDQDFTFFQVEYSYFPQLVISPIFSSDNQNARSLL